MKTAVITGYGLVTPCGEDASEIFRTADNITSTCFADRVSDDFLRHRLPGRNLRTLDRTSQLLAVAASMALESAAIPSSAGRNIGLINGTMFSSGKTISAFDCRALREGPAMASALDFANTVINASTGQTAICYGLSGENTTISTGLSSGLKAIARAVDAIRSGRSTTLLAGGVEELSDELKLAFVDSGMFTASTVNKNNSDVPGFRLSEGAALLVIEEETAAAARGARAFGKVAGVGSAFDVSIDGDQQSFVDSVVQSMRLSLDEACFRPNDIDCVVTSQNGLEFPDECERQAISQLFGCAHPPRLLAPKAIIGESLGAGGPMQMISALLRMSQSLPVRCLRILVNSISYDGHCCSVLLTGTNSQNAFEN